MSLRLLYPRTQTITGTGAVLVGGPAVAGAGIVRAAVAQPVFAEWVPWTPYPPKSRVRGRGRVTSRVPVSRGRGTVRRNEEWLLLGEEFAA